MPLQSRIAHKCNKLTQAYLKGEQLLLEFIVDGEYHPVRILRRAQRSLIDELRSHLCSNGSKRRFSISIESMNGDSYGAGRYAAFVQDVASQSPTTKALIHPQDNRNSTIYFLADHGSVLPPALERNSVISPLIGAIACETILEEEEEEEEEEPSELNAIICHKSDQSSSPPQNQAPHTSRPLSYDPQIALQAIYTISQQNRTLSPPQLPSTLRIGTARPNASSETAQNPSPAPARRRNIPREAIEDPTRNDEFSRFQASIPADIRESMERMGAVARGRRRGYGGL